MNSKNFLKQLFPNSSSSSSDDSSSEDEGEILNNRVSNNDDNNNRAIHVSMNGNIQIDLNHDSKRGIAFQLWPAASYLCNHIEQNYENIHTMIKAKTGAASSSSSSSSSDGTKYPLNVLELGAGIGLVGIFCGSLFTTSHINDIIITDLPETVPIINENIALNQQKYDANNRISCNTLRWGNVEDLDAVLASYANPTAQLVVVLADCVYWECLYQCLYDTLFALINNYNAVVLMGHVKRWKKENKFFNLIKKTINIDVLQENIDHVVDSQNQQTYRVIKKVYCMYKKTT